MAYTMNKDIPVEGNGSAFLDAGIHENIKLTDVKYDESRNGNKFIAFYFQDGNGNQVPKTEWEPKGEGEDLERKQANVMQRLKHIAVNSGILSEDEFQFSVDSFEELGKKVEELLKSKKDQWDKNKLRIKVVYDNNNYTTLPRYTKFACLENMNKIPSEQSKIKILPAIDKMKRDEADNEPQVNTNPFDNAQEQSDQQKSKDDEAHEANVPF